MNRTFLSLALFLCAFSLHAQDRETARAFVVPDVEVQTQGGDTRHLYSDLIKGRVVAMNFVFTSCTTICPTMGATFARVQKLLAERGSKAALLSVSIDPLTDTPERLSTWSKRLGAQPGWTLVTGDPTDIETILKAVGLYTADPASHTPVVLVANGEGAWERVDGLATPTAIADAIARLEGKGK